MASAECHKQGLLMEITGSNENIEYYLPYH